MDRRGGRPSQVRPRPPSTGRPVPVKVRPRSPAPGRVAAHRPIERRRGLPLIVRAGLVLAVVALGLAVFGAATGGFTRVVAAIGDGVEGFLDDLAATPRPSATPVVVSDAPFLEAPEEPYTNVPTVDLVVTLPQQVVGDPGTILRLYLALPEQSLTAIDELPVGPTRRLVIPDVLLTPGRNDFSATLEGPAGETDSSPVVTYILDQSPPRIELTTPKDGATINRPAVELTGKTQGRTALVVRNEANNASVVGASAADGTFSLSMPIVAGVNGITIKATDPAGNVTEQVISVRRGSGKLAALVTANPVRLSRAQLPRPLNLTVAVTDPDGGPLEGASVTFIITTPGVPPVTSSETLTRGDGKATFSTTLPDGADPGAIGISVLVTTTEFGTTTAHTAVTITP
jgi:hypothetical protein